MCMHFPFGLSLKSHLDLIFFIIILKSVWICCNLLFPWCSKRSILCSIPAVLKYINIRLKHAIGFFWTRLTPDVCSNTAIMVHNEVCFTALPQYIQWSICRQWRLENADGYILLHPPRPQCHPLKLPTECRGVNSWGSSVIGWHTHGTACGPLQAAQAGLGIAFGSYVVMCSTHSSWKRKVLTRWSYGSFINEEAAGTNRSTCSFGILRETHS